MSKKPHPIDSFRNVMGALQAENAAALVASVIQEPMPPPALPTSPAPSSAKPVEPVESKAVGRPKSGKKSDASYCQTSILIKKETRNRVKSALLQTGESPDMSLLVQNLLENWLKSL